MELMARYRIRRLPVTKDGKLVGIVSDRDLRQLKGRPSLKLPNSGQEEVYQKLPVEEVMTSTVITIRENQTLKEAIISLLNNRISGFPVVNSQGSLVSMLSEADILKHYLGVLELEANG